MLKLTSVSGLARGITAITRTVITVRTGIIIDLIIGHFTGRIIGTAGTAITAIIIPIITGASLVRNSHTRLVRSYFEPACFFGRRDSLAVVRPHKIRGLFS